MGTGNERIVVWDPTGEYEEGQVLGDAQVGAYLESRGGVVLPVTSSMLGRVGVGGYQLRGYGAGIPLDSGAPKRLCPMTVWIDARLNQYAWKAMLIPADPAMITAAIAGTVITQGSLRLITEAPVEGTMQAVLSPGGQQIVGATLGQPKHGGWLVGGSGSIQVSRDGYHGFALYGAMLAMRVAWSAVSVFGSLPER